MTGPALAALLLSACGSAEQEVAQPRTIAVTGVRIVDGTGAPATEGGLILIEDGRIAYAGPLPGPEDGAAELTIDGNGLTALPGLADMHVHLVGGWDGYTTDMLGYQRYLNSLLYAGVTTVMDVGNVLPFVHQMKQELGAGRLVGPRLYMAGPLIDGHPAFWPPLSFPVSDGAGVRAVAEQLADMGVDILKGYGGLSADLADTLIAAAAELDLPTVFDLGGRPGAFAAAAGRGMGAAAHVPPGDLSDETVSDLVDHGSYVITTLAVMESFEGSRFDDVAFLDDPLIANTTPPWFLDDIRRHRPPGRGEGGDRFVERWQSARQTLRRLHEAGVPLIAGTDAPYPGVFQGEGIHRELELLVREAGLSPLEAIRTATFNAASFLGAAGEWGSLAEGRVADVLIVEGDPSVDISNTRRVRYVLQGGRVLDRASLELDVERDPGFRTGAAVN